MADQVTMPEGLERIPREFQDSQAEKLKSAQALDKQIRQLADIVKKNDSQAANNLTKMSDAYKESMEGYLESQKDIEAKVIELAKAGATSEEIGLYLKKNSAEFEDQEIKLSSELLKLRKTLADMATSIKYDNAEAELVAFRQLKAIEKSIAIEEETNKKKLFPFLEKLTDLQEDIVKGAKEGKNKGLSQVLSTLTGPLRLVVDPFLELAGTSTEEAIEAGLNKLDERSETKKKEEKEKPFEDRLGKDKQSSIFEKLDKTPEKLPKELPNRAPDPLLLPDTDSSDRAGLTPSEVSLKQIDSPLPVFIVGESVGLSEVARLQDTPPLLLRDVTPEQAEQQSVLSLPAPDVQVQASAPLLLEDKTQSETLREDRSNPITVLAQAESPGIVESTAEFSKIENNNSIVDQSSETTPFFEKEVVAPENPVSNINVLAPENPAASFSPIVHKTEKLSPREAELLAKGGAAGAGAVYIGNILEDILAKKSEGVSEDEGILDGALDDILPGKSKGSLGKTAGKAKGALGFGAANVAAAAIPVAMLAGGAALQARDQKDANFYFKKGDAGRGVENMILGDRDRLTEENAGSEFGRAVGKNALIAGGVAGTVAAGSAAIGAGGAALAGGATLASAGSAALGAVTLGAVVPPVLIAAAIAAGATAVAKGTQEAYELQYDKNATEIQRNLTQKMADPDTKFIGKLGAGIERDWKSMTATMAGGIRGATEEVTIQQEGKNEEQLSILQKEADAGNQESKRLYEVMSKDSFKKMTKKEKERLLKSEALEDEYQALQDKTAPSMFENLGNSFKTALKASEGVVETAHKNLEGRTLAEWEKQKISQMDSLKGEDVARLKSSKSYQEAIASGQDSYKALQTAYLDEEKAMAKARGEMKADGSLVDLADGFKSFMLGSKLLSDEEITQSKGFNDRRLQLMSEGKSSEEASSQALTEMRTQQQQEFDLRLKQTKEYKEHYDQLIKEGKSKEDAEKDALSAVKKDKELSKRISKSFLERCAEMWKVFSDFAGKIGEAIAGGAKAVGSFVLDKVGDVRDFITGRSPEEVATSAAAKDPTGTGAERIDDGIVKADGTVIHTSPDDTIIATKNTPQVMGDVETRAAAAAPRPAPAMSDANIVAVLNAILTAVQSKEFSPSISIPPSGGESAPDFGALRFS